MFSNWFKGMAVAAGLAAGLSGGSLQIAAAHAQDMGDQGGSQQGYPTDGYPVDNSQDQYPGQGYQNPGYGNPADQNGYPKDNGYGDQTPNGYDQQSPNGYDNQSPNGYDDQNVATFDAALSPYGTWEDTQDYGRVWRPDPYVVGADFVPYGTAGQWQYTDYGWSWNSDWAWGWAPFHYGRWALDAVFGWVWIPGSVWAPAWVDWRYGNGYVGWCPLGPAGYVWHGYGWYHYPYWNFVQTQYFVHPNPIHYAVPAQHVHGVMAATVPLHNTVGFHGAHWYGGPPPGHIATATGHAITPVGVRPPTPGHIAVVRPGFTNQAPPTGFHGQSIASGFRGPQNGGFGTARPPPTSIYTRPVAPYHGSTGMGMSPGFSSHGSNAYGAGIVSRPAPSTGFSSPHGYGAAPSTGFSSPHGFGSAPPPSHYGSGSMAYGGAHMPPPSGGGFHSAPSMSGGGFHSAPPSTAFHGNGGGGGGGGFHSAPPSGGFHASGGGGGGGGHAAPPAGFHSGRH